MVDIWYYNQSPVTELLIVRDPHNGWMCFESARSSTFLAGEKASASAFSTAKNVAFLELYPIHTFILSRTSHLYCNAKNDKDLQLLLFAFL